MVIPYLNFNGNSKEVMSFYQSVFNAEIRSIMPYGNYVPEGIESPPKNLSDWVMHAEMEICDTKFWFADEIEALSCGNMIKLTVTVPIADIGKGIFERLKTGGEVTLPPTETFYSNFHAALVDKYGIAWNIVSEEPPKQQ